MNIIHSKLYIKKVYKKNISCLKNTVFKFLYYQLFLEFTIIFYLLNFDLKFLNSLF